MNRPLDVTRLVPVTQMTGEDDAETALLRGMAERAEAYLKSFKWCPPIAEQRFGFGIGGIVAVFLFRLVTTVGGKDDTLWVVEGDLPSAYLVTDDAPDAASALAVYCRMMDEWAEAVLSGTALDRAFPIEAPATPEMATMLLSRTKFIREQLIPRQVEGAG